MKAIVLLSGGLDSRLAIRLIQEQGVALEAVNFFTIFCTCTAKSKSCSEAVSAARSLGVALRTFNVTEELMEAVENPRFGYGRGVNPCLDCRVLMLRQTARQMRERGASFIITGEVLGERPMSQRRDALKKIEKEAGLEGLILRPLSARLLEPTVPEKRGWVKRESLLNIQGRSRRPQMEMARRLNLNDYPCPAGGCRLTEKHFARKVRDLIEHGQWNLEQASILTIGRHFRLRSGPKAIVGRDEKENERIRGLKTGDDLLLEPVDIAGPTVLLKGSSNPEEVILAGRLAASYTKSGDGALQVKTSRNGSEELIEVRPLSAGRLNELRISG